MIIPVNIEVLDDHVGSLLRHHDDGRVGVTADQLGHGASVHHPEPLQPPHPQPGVVLQKVLSELHPKVRNHGEGPY